MRKNIFLFFVGLLLLGGFSAHAQSTVGLKAGFNLPGLGDPFVNDGFSSKVGGTYALMFGHKFGEVVGVRAHLEYSELVRKRDAYQGFYIPRLYANNYPELRDFDYAYANLNSNVKDKYYLVPVMIDLGYNFNEKIFNGVREEYLRVYISGGGFVGFLSESRQRLASLKSGIYADPNWENQILPREEVETISKKRFNTARENYDRFAYGVSAYIGFEYNFFYHNAVFFEVGGNYGLNNLAKEPINGKIFPRSLSIMVGYKWSI